MINLVEILRQEDPLFLQRIEKLKKWEGSNELIAGAKVIGDKLIVLGCDLVQYEVYFDDLVLPTPIAVEDRENFELDADGSYLYWENSDTHLDLEAFRRYNLKAIA